MKLTNMKIRKRLIFGFFAPYLMSAILLLFCILNMLSMKGSYETIVEQNVNLERQILNARIHMNTAARYVRDITLDQKKANYNTNTSSLNAAMNDLNTSINSITQSNPEYTSTGIGQEFVEGVKKWQNTVPEILSAIERNDFEVARKLLIEKCTPTLNKQAEIAKQLTNNIEDSVKQTLTKQDRTSLISIVVVIGAIVIVSVLNAILASRVVKSFTKPLDEVKEAITAFSKGKFDVPVLYDAEDEVAEMADALRTSQSVLQTVIAEIDRTTGAMAEGDFNIKIETNFPGTLKSISDSIERVVKNLSETIDEVKNTMDRVSMNAEQVSSGSQSLAQGATEQASAVEELSATLNDISAMSHENANSAKTAKYNTDKASEQNMINKEKMHEMIQAMDNITSASQEIRKIIKTIEDIAFQTNILALNAAVEAARAGSAGKGFAVVADEVRNLASKSAEAAKNTTKLIADSIEAVERGSEIAYSAAESIESSVVLTGQAVEQITQIASAVERESEAIRQITQGIDQIATVVQTNSATSEESAAASQELSTQANMMHEVLRAFNTAQQPKTIDSTMQSSMSMRTAPQQTYYQQKPTTSFAHTSTYQPEYDTTYDNQYGGGKYDDKYDTVVAMPSSAAKNITHYEVTPDLETGNDLIDSEHRELFQDINDLLDACTVGAGRAQITKTVNFLADYVDKHFNDEEALQKEFVYPNYEPHKKFHTQYKADIRQMANEIKREGATLQTLSHVTDLANTLVSHIRHEDKRLAAYIRSQEQNKNV